MSPVPALAPDPVGDRLQQSGRRHAWPSASLTDLKSSRSTNSTTTGSASGPGDAQGVVHAVEEQRPVGETGQLVVERAVAELALEVALLGDVAERGDDAVDRGAAEEVGDHDVGLALLAVGTQQRGLELDRAAVAGLDEPFELVLPPARVPPRRPRRGGDRPTQLSGS